MEVPMRPETANVFDLDAGLAALANGARGADLRRRGEALTYRLPRGPVDFDRLSRVRGWGLLVLEGFITRQTRLAGRSAMELLGRGDLLRPWDEPHAGGPVPVEATWRTVEPARIAILDQRFMAGVAPYLEVTERLTGRLLQRSRWSSLMLLVSRLPWTEGRILVLFWHLAERWGHRLPGGDVSLPLGLPHAQVGELVSAQRPTVTMAINQLARTGAISRGDAGWVLHGGPPSPADLEREAMAAAFRVRKERPRVRSAAEARG